MSTPSIDDFPVDEPLTDEEIVPQEIPMDPHELVSEHDSPDLEAGRQEEQLEAEDHVDRLVQIAQRRGKLDEDDKALLDRRFGLFGAEQASSLEQIGRERGVTGGVVRQREIRIIKALRDTNNSHIDK